MKKIKAIKLLKDLPGYKAGIEIIDLKHCSYDDIRFAGFRVDEMKNYPDFFNIEYEQKYFELPNLTGGYALSGDRTNLTADSKIEVGIHKDKLYSIS